MANIPNPQTSRAMGEIYHDDIPQHPQYLQQHNQLQPMDETRFLFLEEHPMRSSMCFKQEHAEQADPCNFSPNKYDDVMRGFDFRGDDVLARLFFSNDNIYAS